MGERLPGGQGRYGVITLHCDECEDPIDKPYGTTDGDHYWCKQCWDERAAYLKERREEQEGADAD